MQEHPLDKSVVAAGGRVEDAGGVTVVHDYGDPQSEYAAALRASALYDARERGLIEVAGKDRAAWLHNLLTNAVKTLASGDGVYAFATNAKGRILFDCNVIVRPDDLWVDVDRRFLSKAMAHFERYHIAEDIRLTDRTDAFARIVLLGPEAPNLVAQLGATHAARLPSVGSTQVLLEGKPRLLVRNDSWAGVYGLEVIVEATDAAACWDRLIELGGPAARPIGRAALDVLRIEAGIPVYGRDIDEEVLPAETLQNERAISYTKGCYLGQEVVERMRSRGGLARKLVGLTLTGSGSPPAGANLMLADAHVGRLTSTCVSFATGDTIALGYVKTTHAAPGTALRVDGTSDLEARVTPLPFRG